MVNHSTARAGLGIKIGCVVCGATDGCEHVAEYVSPVARKFFMLETGAPMDSIVCGVCLPAASPAIKVTELDSASVAANYAEEGSGGCDVCGAEFRDVLRRVGFPDGTVWIGVPPEGTSHASIGHNGRVFEVIEFHRDARGGELALWAHKENYDRGAVVVLRKV